MKIRIPENVVSRDMAGESMLLDLDTGSYFGLDAVGSRIWHLIEEMENSEEVEQVLLQEYEVDAARLREDLTGLLEELSRRSLVEITDNGQEGPRFGS